MAKSVALKQNICTKIIWEIENFHLDGNLESEEFTLLGLRCKFNLYVSEWGSYPWIRLMSIDEKKSLRPFYATTFVETPDRLPYFYQTLKVETLQSMFFKKIWKLKNVTKEEIADAQRLLRDDVKFVLLCTPTDSSRTEHISTQTLSQMNHLSCLESLSSDFSNLLVNGSQTDVLVKCGDRTIPAHTLVLSARSEVFSAMFRTDMLESRTGSVDIGDLNQSDLEQLLHYIYAGKVENLTVENAQCLYAAGNKYAVHELQIKCRAFLLENLNEANAYSLLVFSDVQSDEDLKNAVIDFLVRNKELIKSDAWLKFSDKHLRLAVEVYRVYAVKN